MSDPALVDLKRRLHNWGRAHWFLLMVARPNGNGINSIYDHGSALSNDNDGWGEVVDGSTVIVVQQEAAKAEYDEIDWPDAESIDLWIAQLHDEQAEDTLRLVYVFRPRKGDSARMPGWGEQKRAHNALLSLIKHNRAVIERMTCRKSV